MAAIPASLKAACRAPVDLPERDLDSGDAATLWAEDRAALGDCGRRHKALADAATTLEHQGE